MQYYTDSELLELLDTKPELLVEIIKQMQKEDAEKTYKRLLNIDTDKVEIIQKSKGESEIPVAVASILAKNAFNEEVVKMSKLFKIDFRNTDPKDIPKDILKKTAKAHFKNISKILQN